MQPENKIGTHAWFELAPSRQQHEEKYLLQDCQIILIVTWHLDSDCTCLMLAQVYCQCSLCYIIISISLGDKFVLSYRLCSTEIA